MARSTFGGFGGDQVSLDPAGNAGFYKAAANYTSGTFWGTSTGTGTPYTDLIDPVTSVALTGVSTDAHGHVVPFKGPNGITEGWLDFGSGRFKVTAVDANLADAQVSTNVNTTGSATDVALKAKYAPALPASPAALNLLRRNAANTAMEWTTSQASVALGLGWQVLASTGGSDDGPMINNALAALPAGGGTVYLTGGNQYNHSTPIVLGEGMFLRGAGAGASRLNYTGTSGTYAVSVGANGNWGMVGVTITAGASGVGCFQINGGSGNHNGLIAESRFFCAAATTPAMDINGNVNELTIHHNLFQNGGAVGMVQAASGANNVRFVNNSIAMLGSGSNGNGLTVAPGCDNWLIAGNNFEGSNTGNVGCAVGGTTATTVKANYFESWKGACISANTATGCRALAIEGNSVQATSSAAACISINSAGPNIGISVRDNNSGTLGNTGFCAVLIIPGATKRFTESGNTSGGSSTTIVSYLAPAVTALAGAGTSPPTPTSTATGGLSGTVSWGTGTSTAIGAQIQVQYSNPLVTAASVTITPLNAATAALQPYIHGTATATGFNIGFGVAPAASQAATTYQVAFTVTGY